VDELQTTYVDLNYAQALLVMGAGIGVMLLQPLAVKCGRRLAYLIGSVLILAGLLAGLYMSSVGLFFVYMALAGLGSGPSYATIVTSLLDISFLHQKGFYLSLYGGVLLFANFLPPVAAGYIIESQGWLWCFRYLLIFFGMSTLLLLATAEESSFSRDAYNAVHLIQGHAAAPQQQPQSGSPTKANDPDHMSVGKEGSAAGADVASKVPPTQDTPAPTNTIITTSMHSFSPARHRYLQRMTLFRCNADVKASYVRLVVAMFEVAVLPATLWASIQLAISTFVVSLVMTTQASFFAAPPYEFGPSQLGLMYFAILIGCLIGAVWGGSGADWLVKRLAIRNGGMHEPESRLWAYLPMAFCGAGGCLLYGLGANAGLHWAVPCLGLVLIGIYLNACLPIAVGYALDCYPELEDETIQLSNFVRNILGGAFTFCIQPWIDLNGAQNTTIIMAMLVFVLCLTSIVFQIWGKTIRIKLAARYYAICERCRRY
jgi:MFS family permease